MLTDKQQKKAFKDVASKDPDAYFPTAKLKAEGFIRKRCACGTWFWNVDPARQACGDPGCAGGFNVVSNNPSKVKLSYEGVWKKIIELLGPRGYAVVDRYPVVARWNPTTEYTMASIAAFQPYVITGEVEPPARKLVIPQFCLRFGDVDNVGITGSHCTGFVMIGQHAFLSPEEWNQEALFTDIYEFLTTGIGLEKAEITIHEDAWAGGGSFGPCMEFFSRGVELFNQVYTMFEQTPDGPRELKLKVLDMGLGMERIAWFSQGTPNLYEATFPGVLNRIREITGVSADFDLYRQFSRFSAYLNVDEVDDIGQAWERVATEMGVSINELREKIMPMAAIYSIAEHARSLLVAIVDGGLPSNTGGGYNLRVILRRALSFIDKHGWDLDLGTVCEWHATELSTLFPELLAGIDTVTKIIAFERQKYEETRENVKRALQRLVKDGKEITVDRLLEMYDSQGISPELVKREAAEGGLHVVVPDNFYKLVSELHEKREQVHATRKDAGGDTTGIPDTVLLYFDDYTITSCTARVLKVDGTRVMLNRTVAYPTSGGQLHDTGDINGIHFGDVIKDGGVIVHVLDTEPPFIAGDEVTVDLDKTWRDQLTKHHTATHVVNAAARIVLGSHVNQAGAKKTMDKAHLDITHYDSLTPGQERAIEQEANRIVDENVQVAASFMPRAAAEKAHGMGIYQGGAVPGKTLRIVKIGNDLDVEACGGTHLHSSGEVGRIKIVKSSKIQDGIVRIEFTAGPAAEKTLAWEREVLEETARVLGVPPAQVPARGEELFTKWKRLKKVAGKGKDVPGDLLVLNETRESTGDALAEISAIFKTQPEHVPKNAEKFLRAYEALVQQAKAAMAANQAG